MRRQRQGAEPVRQPVRRRASRLAARRPTSSTRPSSRRRSSADAANVMRQALAGMLWSKQFYHYDVDKWLEERGSDPFKPTRKPRPRNDHWHHMYNGDVISMPDKWEYPVVRRLGPRLPRARADAGRPGFRQAAAEADAARALHAPQRPDPGLRVELRRRQPAGARLVHHLHLPPGEGAARARATRTGSRAASRSCCSTSPGGSTARTAPGSNVFEGGFLGLDNIGVFDRSAPLPTGGYLEQADGTAWMALFCQNMLEIAVELAHDRPGLRGHGAQVRRALPVDRLVDDPRWAATPACGTRRTASSTTCCGCPTARPQRLKVRSMVGLLPLCAATVFDGELLEKYPEHRRALAVVPRGPSGADARPSTIRRKPGMRGRRLGFDPGRDQAPPRAGEDARRERVPQPLRHPLAVALPRRASVRVPRRRPGVPRRLSAGRVRHRHVRRQLELARADLDAGQRA